MAIVSPSDSFIFTENRCTYTSIRPRTPNGERELIYAFSLLFLIDAFFRDRVTGIQGSLFALVSHYSCFLAKSWSVNNFRKLTFVDSSYTYIGSWQLRKFKMFCGSFFSSKFLGLLFQSSHALIPIHYRITDEGSCTLKRRVLKKYISPF